MPDLLQTSAIMVFQFSVVSSPDEFIFGRLFFCYEIIQTVCLFCALSSSAFGIRNISTLYFLSSPSALLTCPKNCGCLFLIVSSRDLLYQAISIISSFDFFSAHHILIILLMIHIFAALSFQHSHPYRRMDHN